MLITFVIFSLALFIIFWAMLGYPFSLRLLNIVFRPKSLKKDYDLNPSVTILVVAHNEEKVIYDKLENLSQIDYPMNKLKIIVSSDNSTDNTNEIVENYIQKNREFNIELYVVKERKGKINAQNEAQKLVDTELLILTDANSMFDKLAVKELVSSFISDEIVYVCGKLVYTNGDINDTANLEANYWDIELINRKIESNFQTIVAGNGAIYAIRNRDYIHVPLIESHDSAMPYYYAMKKRRALFNPNAIAYEKAGESIKDEFKRKVRMRRRALSASVPRLKPLNIFKYRWFTYFYIGHRYSRDILWLAHIVLLVSNILLALNNIYFSFILAGHVLVYIIALFQHIFKTKFKTFNFIYYYNITVFAQYVGVFNQLTGKSKPFWDKAESTR